MENTHKGQEELSQTQEQTPAPQQGKEENSSTSLNEKNETPINNTIEPKAEEIKPKDDEKVEENKSDDSKFQSFSSTTQVEQPNNSDDNVPEEIEKEEPNLNLLFYMDKIKSKPFGKQISFMHEKWWGDYEELEDNHAYIQWLFPNFYQSMFNGDAQPLTKKEAEEFKSNLEIAKRLLKSYELILDFYGVKITDHEKGTLERTQDFKKRYHEGLILYTHNHLRMRRILMHLNNVGFRRYAIELVKHWEKEIFGEVGGYEKFRNKETPKGFKDAPLNKLATSKVFDTWRLYGDHNDDKDRIEGLEKNTFMKWPEDFERESVFFKDLSEKKGNI